MVNKRFWFSVWTVTLLSASLKLGPIDTETYKFLMTAVIGGFLGVQSWTDLNKIKEVKDVSNPKN